MCVSSTHTLALLSLLQGSNDSHLLDTPPPSLIMTKRQTRHRCSMEKWYGHWTIITSWYVWSFNNIFSALIKRTDDWFDPPMLNHYCDRFLSPDQHTKDYLAYTLTNEHKTHASKATVRRWTRNPWCFLIDERFFCLACMRYTKDVSWPLYERSLAQGSSHWYLPIDWREGDPFVSSIIRRI